MSELLFKEEVYAIIGAAVEVHKELGNGFLEPIYREAFEIELASRKIDFEPQKRLDIFYKGRKLHKEYIPDLICFGQIVVEIKAIEKLTNSEIAQIINYLKATKLRVGLLINFGSKGKLEWKRFIV